jgi:hypothetical protein
MSRRKPVRAESDRSAARETQAVFERFTDRARRVLVLAQEEARLLNHSFIGTEHLLLGLIAEGEGLAAKALESLEISLEAVRREVEEIIGQAGSVPTGSPPFTPRAKKVLELALREALQLGHNYIGTEHILLGLVREGQGVAAQVLIRLGADLVKVRQAVIEQLGGYQGRDPQSHPGMRVRRTGRLPFQLVTIGDVVTVEVVRRGRGPEVFAEAHGRLANLVAELGVELDAGRLDVSSVDTDGGPGLRLFLRQELHASAPGAEDGAPGGVSPS